MVFVEETRPDFALPVHRSERFPDALNRGAFSRAPRPWPIASKEKPRRLSAPHGLHHAKYRIATIEGDDQYGWACRCLC